MLSVSMLFHSTVCTFSLLFVVDDFMKLSDWLATYSYFAREAFNFVGRKFCIGFVRFRYPCLEKYLSPETHNLYKTGFVYSRWKEEHVRRYSDVATCNDIFYVVVRYGRDALDKIVVWKSSSRSLTVANVLFRDHATLQV